MRTALAVAALALFPSAASAAPFGELPFRPVTSAATCLAPTGVPGGLVRWTPDGAELLDATAGGLVPQAELALGKLRGCPEAAIDSSGAGVVAGATSKGIRVVVRDPGGTWGAPVALGSTLGSAMSVAVSARGDAVVTWLEWGDDYRSVTVLIARRAPGGAFGTPERIAVDFTVSQPTVALTAAGDVLLAVPDGDGTALFDREPGGEFIRRPAVGADGEVAVAMAADGTAIVAWESAGRVTALRRAQTGAFGPPIAVQDELPRRRTENSFGLVGLGDGPPPDRGRLRVALGADGRALLAWPGIETGLQAASVLADNTAEVMNLGSPVRPAGGMTPLLLADGTRAVAWTDSNEFESSPPYSGRLHLAVEGAADTPAAAAPELTVGAPRDRTLRPIQPLELPVRCSAACDVRGYIVGHSGGASVALARAGSRTLSFGQGTGALVPKRGALKVRLTWSAPGARTASTRTISLRLRRLPAPPLPHLLDVRARRAPGGIIDVRWRTDGPAQDALFVVIGARTKRVEGDRDPRSAYVTRRLRRRSFYVKLRDARAVRYVTVYVAQLLGGERHVRVRVQ